jgi:hypothetical protein
MEGGRRMIHGIRRHSTRAIGLLAAGSLAVCAGRTGLTQRAPAPPSILGRWDLTVTGKSGPMPSWLEVTASGRSALVGRFVGVFGSARPIGEVQFRRGRATFAIPPQWEEGEGPIRFDGRVRGDSLSGRISGAFFEGATFTARRAPSLARHREPEWSEEVELFNGRDLAGWKPRDAKKAHGWVARNGILTNAKPGNDLVSTRTFGDFKLHAEFRYPKGSNSGVYLRGRYEVQIEDLFGRQPDSHGIGGVYGFLEPRINAAKRPGEWQSYDITLVGRYVTVVLNGELVIDRQRIPGITGGALDSREGEPGPILIQGDHGPIDFREITVTPAR